MLYAILVGVSACLTGCAVAFPVGRDGEYGTISGSVSHYPPVPVYSK